MKAARIKMKAKTAGALLLIGLVLFGILYLFFHDIKAAQDKRDKVAIQGYDAMAYYLLNKAQKGSREYQVEWNKSVWWFHTSENRDLFEKDPDRYAPQYGGNCAFTTSMGKAQQGLPKYWEIRDGKLYLNANFISHQLWKLLPNRLSLADRRWKEMTRRPK